LIPALVDIGFKYVVLNLTGTFVSKIFGGMGVLLILLAAPGLIPGSDQILFCFEDNYIVIMNNGGIFIIIINIKIKAWLFYLKYYTKHV